MRLGIVEEKVIEVLQRYPVTRNDDWKLIAYVFNEICPDTQYYKFNAVMLGHKELGLPAIESITRARRKAQETRPELRAEKEVWEQRMERQEEFKLYAIGGE